jgi:predicted LPLAT superfamily acyltransferase
VTPNRSSAAQWTTQPERSNLFWLRAMTWLSLRLGRRISRVILHLITAYFLLFAPVARRASFVYLQRALGRTPQWRDRYRHFFTFAATIHDRIYLLNSRFKLFSVTTHGEALLKMLLSERKGIVLVGAHFGSFEIIHTLGLQQPGLSIAIAMFEENARKIKAALATINPHIDHDIIALGHINTMLQVQQRLEAGALIGILGDRSMHDDPAQTVDFLGAPAEFPIGPLRLAAVLRCPVIFMASEYRGGNRYALSRAQRSAAVATAVTTFAQCLERHCRSAPYNWFNFFDFWQSARTRIPTDNDVRDNV